MRVYISMDAEGISGIYKLSQTVFSNPDFPLARKLMASDINAAARGAFAAGATEVFVNDAHNYGNNLIITDLDSRITLCSGFDRPLSMAEGAQRGFDAALLIGYHMRKGARGVISHSYAYASMVDMWLNGKLISEAELVGYVCGHFGTPVKFLSGDDMICAAVKGSMPGIHTVAVKECIGNGAAACIHPEKTAKMIEEAVREALLDNTVPLLRTEGEVELKVRFSAESQGRLAAGAPGAVRIDDCTTAFRGPDYLSAYRSFLSGTALCGTFRDDADLYK